MFVYKTKGKIWIYAAEKAAWYFVYVDKNVSEKIKKERKRHIVFGSVKVKVTIGATHFETSLFPDKRSSCYLLPLKKSVRAAENLFEGDEIEFQIEIKE